MPQNWNGDLVVYAHGYVAPDRPVGIPEDQLELPGGARIDTFITDQGYAFATTGYSVNGLAVIQGQADLVDLVSVFTRLKGPPGKVLLVGVSEGGLIATLLAERRPSVFDGVFALCGPYGDFAAQIDYVGDFRVLFDYYFPDLLPPSPVDVPGDLLATWETTTYSTTVQPLMEDPANSSTVDELLKVAGVAYSTADPASRERSIERMLWYNIYGTNDATAKLGGQPFNNEAPPRTYKGSGDDAALNRDVARFTASPLALAAVAADYQTSGRIGVPVVTLHTTLDPVVPLWHQALYTAKVQAAGAGPLYEAYQQAGYGHCAFSPLEVLSAFGRLTTLVDEAVKPQLYLPALSTAAAVAP
jgi:pimeloyl-ACP methyl ester carboxylesterase